MGPLARSVFAAVLATTACQPDDVELPPILWEGHSLRYRSDEPIDRICGGTFEHLDERAAHIGALFDDSRPVVDYVWTPGARLQDFCEGSTLGCQVDGAAFTIFPLNEHELVHARGHGGQRALEEGVAVAFGDDQVLAGNIEDSDLETVLRESGPFSLPDGVHYPRLGHFVSYLRAFYGHRALVELIDATSIDDDYDRLAAAVESVLGIPMDEVLADYEASYPICDSTHFRYDGFDCGRNTVALPLERSEEIDISVRVGRDEATTLGPRAGEIWTVLTLDVPTSGRFGLDVFTEEAGTNPQIRLRQCDAACDEIDLSLPEGPGVWSGLSPCLSAGAYSLRLSLPEGTAASFRIRAERFDTQTCD